MLSKINRSREDTPYTGPDATPAGGAGRGRLTFGTFSERIPLLFLAAAVTTDQRC
jgi:hypothetical protein